MPEEHDDLHVFRTETRAAVEAVTRALEIAVRPVDAGGIASKGGRDVVTATDVAVEDEVRAALAESSDWVVVGEERGGTLSADGSAYWLVDPICGTRNYASGIPLTCINLALVEGGQVVTGVVADPATGEITLAERGRGAWALHNGALRRVAVSGDSATVIVEDGKAKGGRREHAARFCAAAIRADRWDFRSLGTSLSLPYVAAGRVSAYVCFAITREHAAAGSILVSEAGGTLTDVLGEPWTVHSTTLVASATPELHYDLLDMARATWP